MAVSTFVTVGVLIQLKRLKWLTSCVKVDSLFKINRHGYTSRGMFQHRMNTWQPPYRYSLTGNGRLIKHTNPKPVNMHIEKMLLLEPRIISKRNRKIHPSKIVFVKHVDIKRAVVRTEQVSQKA